MSAIDGVRVRSPEAGDGAPIVTLTVEGADPASVARRLDEEWDVQVSIDPNALQLDGTIDGTLTGEVHIKNGQGITDGQLGGTWPHVAITAP